MIRTPASCVLLALACHATAQQSIVIPAVVGAGVGNTANAFPWGWNAAGYGGLRHQGVYSAANFTSQSVNYPILVTRLRWRPASSASSATGGTFAQATVALSTAAVAYGSVTNSFAANHGADYTLCYSGPVTHQSSGPAGTPKPWSVDVQLTTPFSYSPSQGDLLIDVDYPGGSNFSGGSLPGMDVQTTGSMASRVWGSTQYPGVNGVWFDHGVVVEVTFLPAGPGVAWANSYGAGCYDRFASFYELFPAGTFDLSNQALSLVPLGAGYIVVPAAPAWRAPSPASALPLGNDTVSAPQALGFTLAYPGGTTSAVRVSSNGFVWAQPNSQAGCCGGDPVALLAQAARWCPLWTDLNPAAAGTVHFEQDPAGGAAYVTFDNVAENGSGVRSSFQVAFFAGGIVEYRYQQCAVTNFAALTGWSPGGGVRDPGSVDLSTALPVFTEVDTLPLHLAAGGRPVVSTTVLMTASNVPAGSPLGVFVAGLGYFDPGLDLTSLGMPGCRQHVTLDGAVAFVPAGGAGIFPLQVPNDPGLSGVHVYLQAAAMAPGSNLLGVLSSNGVDLRVGTQ